MGELVVPAELFVRVCDACGGVDDHPRHTFGGGDRGAFPHVRPEAVAAVLGNPDLSDDDKGRYVAELADLSTQALHYDCCRAHGCPKGTCDVLSAGAETLRGPVLRDHVAGFAAFTVPAQQEG
jgi:hypothetical protein